MATKTFTNVNGGNFGTDGNWGPPSHPVACDIADLSSALGGPYNVDVTDAEAAALINITTANAELIVEAGGVLTVGSIAMTAGTLDLLTGGTVTGSTRITDGAAVTTLFNGGTLDGATWLGTLALDPFSGAASLEVTTSLNVLNAAGNGPGVIDITGSGAEMDFASSMTLNGTNGNLAINIGTSTALDQYLGVGSNITLTLGTAVSLSQIPAGSTIHLIDIGGNTGGTIVNNGTMSFSSGAGSGAFITASNFINDGKINLAGGGGPGIRGEDLELTPQNSFAVGASGSIAVSGYGLVHISGPNGSVDVSGIISVSTGGTLDLDPASVAVSDKSGTGVVQVSTGGTVEIDYDYTGTVAFGDPTGQMLLGNQGGGFTGTVVGMSRINSGTLNVIDLLLTSSVTKLDPQFPTPQGGTLFVLENTTTLAAIKLEGNYFGVPFAFGPDGNSGTDIFIGCFVAGSRILTEHGEVPVEGLREGDLVATRSGIGAVCKAVRWIGTARIDLDRHPRARDVTPIRILAGAFGAGLPHRDLLLSPDHAVYVEGVLIPIQYLVNDVSIRREPTGGVVTYYHVELDSHDVLVADGLPAESYLDTGGGANFANGGAVRALYPDFVARSWETEGCAPLVVTGPLLRAVRDRLNARAAVVPDDALTARSVSVGIARRA